MRFDKQVLFSFGKRSDPSIHYQITVLLRWDSGAILVSRFCCWEHKGLSETTVISVDAAAEDVF